jgi:hypothetical protein
MDVNHNAQIIVDLNAVIDARLQTVWNLHTAVDQWPTWQKDISQAGLTRDPPYTRRCGVRVRQRYMSCGLHVGYARAQPDPSRRTQ